MKINILFFGSLSDHGMSGARDVPGSVTDTDSLKMWLGEEDSVLQAALTRTGNRIALNGEFINKNNELKDGDEVAFMSPLSGG